jgi:hypothetical protein
MDKDTAKQIIVRMETCINLLGEVVRIAHANCGEYEDRVVRRGVGHVLSEIQDRLTDPIYREYTDLLPQGIDYAPLEGPTLSEMATKVGLTGS